LGSISPIFYEELLRVKIPIEQKTLMTCLFFALLGSLRVKALRKHVGEIDSWLEVCNNIKLDLRCEM